jgi:hypothetical protein
MPRIAILAFLIALTTASFAQTSAPYPEKGPLFTLVTPQGWTYTKPSSDDDYATLEGPTGAVFYFRAEDGPLDKAKAAGLDEIKDTYTGCKWGAEKTLKLGGCAGILVEGTGVDKEDQSRASFGMAWITLPGGKIAVCWYEAPTDDESALLRAAGILQTFKVK